MANYRRSRRSSSRLSLRPRTSHQSIWNSLRDWPYDQRWPIWEARLEELGWLTLVCVGGPFAVWVLYQVLTTTPRFQ
jgi:hypothetical protein